MELISLIIMTKTKKFKNAVKDWQKTGWTLLIGYMFRYEAGIKKGLIFGLKKCNVKLMFTCLLTKKQSSRLDNNIIELKNIKNKFMVTCIWRILVFRTFLLQLDLIFVQIDPQIKLFCFPKLPPV